MVNHVTIPEAADLLKTARRVLVIGCSGGGKSTLSQAISQQFGMAYQCTTSRHTLCTAPHKIHTTINLHCIVHWLSASACTYILLNQSAKRGSQPDEVFGAAGILPQMGQLTSGQPNFCPKWGIYSGQVRLCPK